MDFNQVRPVQTCDEEHHSSISNEPLMSSHRSLEMTDTGNSLVTGHNDFVKGRGSGFLSLFSFRHPVQTNSIISIHDDFHSDISNEDSDMLPPLIGQNWSEYLFGLAYAVFTAKSNSILARQARLTIFECLEHIDFLNDFIFILRVMVTVTIATNSTIPPSGAISAGYFALYWLINIYITSLIGYLFRSVLIYHRIPPDHMNLFRPILVFKEIRTAGATSPQSLYMYERLYWTYSLIMRVVEDAPQVLASSIFIFSFGRDIYAIVNICFSFLLLIITSIRMGMRYPLIGTISLLLSTQPPVDSPVVVEATYTTYHITLYMATVLGLWTITHVLTLQFVSDFFRIVIIIMIFLTAMGAVAFLSLWAYYSLESEQDVDQRFMRGTSQTYARFDSLYQESLASLPEDNDGGIGEDLEGDYLDLMEQINKDQI